MSHSKYPRLSIRGKNELAKHISGGNFSKEKAQELINKVTQNFDQWWKDNLKHSKPDDDKWVRSAKGTPLGILLKRINRYVLLPHDKLVPNFIFGGLQDRNHVQAAKYLQGTKMKRTLLKLDLRRFFEQMTQDRVISFFINKCNCSYKGARLLAELCCVPLGAKGSGQSKRAIARGFATSSRIAVWCSLDLFQKINQLVQMRLKGKDPRTGIYVDDIGITATKTKKSEMLKLKEEIKYLVENYIRPLYVNDKKTEIIRHDEGLEYVGLKMKRGELALGIKSHAKKMRLKRSLQGASTVAERKTAKRRLKGMTQYEAYIKAI